jgi:hypothetical protein
MIKIRLFNIFYFILILNLLQEETDATIYNDPLPVVSFIYIILI